MQPYLRGELAIVLDAADLNRAADFWSAVLGYRREGPASGRFLSLVPANGPGIELLLQRTDDVKRDKNRLHLDLRTADLDVEVARVVGCGASVLTTEPVVEHGWRWHILADPDGNEFCILQPPCHHGLRAMRGVGIVAFVGTRVWVAVVNDEVVLRTFSLVCTVGVLGVAAWVSRTVWREYQAGVQAAVQPAD